MLWQPPLSCRTCSEVHGTLTKALQKSPIWQLCWSWGPSLWRSWRISGPRGFFSSEFWRPCQPNNCVMVGEWHPTSDESSPELTWTLNRMFLMDPELTFWSALVCWTPRLWAEEWKKTGWRMALRSPETDRPFSLTQDSSNGCTV